MILNSIIAAGELVHEERTYIYTRRISGVIDKIPLKDGEYCANQYGDICIKGHICTENVDGHLKIEVEMDKQCEYYTDMDTFRGFGNICKPPKLRKTPVSDKYIADVILAFNLNNETAYVPCIAWGEHALAISEMKVGTQLYVTGRFQSRIYLKDGEERTAFELSLSTIERLEK